MEDATYNGWTNYETWAVNLWLTNDQGSAKALEEVARDDIGPSAKADSLRAFVEGLCDLDESGLATDLLTTALERVNYREILASVES